MSGVTILSLGKNSLTDFNSDLDSSRNLTPTPELTTIPSNDFEARVYPEERARSIAEPEPVVSSEAVGATLGIYHTGPRAATFTHAVPPPTSLAATFSVDVDRAVDGRCRLPMPPPSSLLTQTPGADAADEPARPGALALAQTTDTEGDNADPDPAASALASDLQQIVAAHLSVESTTMPGTVGVDRYTVRAEESGAHLPVFAAQIESGLLSYNLSPAETRLCGRRAISAADPDGEAARAAAWPARPEACRVVINFGRLFCPCAEEVDSASDATRHAIYRAASDPTARPTSSEAPLDSNGLPNEPVIATAAVYSLSTRSRVSDVFTWPVGPCWGEQPCDEACTAMFTIPRASTSLYVVVLLWRAVAGTMDAICDMYTRCAQHRCKAATSGAPFNVANIVTGKHLPPRFARDLAKMRTQTLATIARYPSGQTPVVPFAISAASIFTRTAGAHAGFALTESPTTAVPTFAPPLMATAAEINPQNTKEVNSEAASYDQVVAAAEALGASLALDYPPEAAGLPDGAIYSPSWRRYRINAALYGDTVFNMPEFHRFRAASGPATLEELLRAARGEDVERAEEAPETTNTTSEVGDADLEVSAAKPKRIMLGEDGSVLKFICDVRAGRATRTNSMGFSLRTNCRLLTDIFPSATPSTRTPCVLPRGLVRPDAAGTFAPAWAPPLSWLLWHNSTVPVHVPGASTRVSDVLVLPVRAPLFTMRDLEDIGQAGYVDEEVGTAGGEDIDKHSRVPAGDLQNRTREPGLALSLETTVLSTLPTYQRILTQHDTRRGRRAPQQQRSSVLAPTAVLDGNCPSVLPPARNAPGGSVADSALSTPDFFITPPAPGTTALTPSADTLTDAAAAAAAGAAATVSTGMELGAAHDMLVISPLSASFKGAVWTGKKVRARNLVVRAEIKADDSVGVGDWERVYAPYPQAASASIAIAHAQAHTPGGDLGNVCGKAEVDPTTGSQGAIPAFYPTPKLGAAAPVRELGNASADAELVAAGGLALAAPLTPAAMTSVVYHSRTPTWTSSMRAALPALPAPAPALVGALPPKLHVLFTFYHVQIRDNDDTNSDEDGGTYTPVGYAFYPLVDRRLPLRVAAARNIRLPVAEFLPPGYMSTAGYRNTRGPQHEVVVPNLSAAHIPWLQTEQDRLVTEEGDKDVVVVRTVPQFHVNIELVSTLRSSSRPITETLAAVQNTLATPPIKLSEIIQENRVHSSAFSDLTTAFNAANSAGVASATDFFRFLPTLLSTSLSALVYSNVCAVWGAGNVKSDSYLHGTSEAVPQAKWRRNGGTTEDETLRRAIFASIVRTVEVAAATHRRLYPDAEQVANNLAGQNSIMPGDAAIRTNVGQARSPLLEGWVTSVYDTIYHGPVVETNDSVQLLPPDLQDAVALYQGGRTGPPQHPVTDAICRSWTFAAGGGDAVLGQVAAGSHQAPTADPKTVSSRQVAASNAWVFFDIIVRELRFALSRKYGRTGRGSGLAFDCASIQRMSPFRRSLARDIKTLVETLTSWCCAHAGDAADVPAVVLLNNSIALFIRDLYEILGSTETNPILEAHDELLRAAAEEAKDDRATTLWSLRLTAWQIVADHPRLAAIASVGLYRAAGVSINQWTEQVLVRSHFVVGRMLQCVHSGMLHRNWAVQNASVNLLCWFIAKLDDNAALETTLALPRDQQREGHRWTTVERLRQAWASLLVGTAHFIVLHGQRLLGAIDGSIVPLSPQLTNLLLEKPATVERLMSADGRPEETEAAYQMRKKRWEQDTERANSLRRRLSLCMLWIMRHMPHSLATLWLQRESSTNRAHIFRALDAALRALDLRRLIATVRATKPSTGDATSSFGSVALDEDGRPVLRRVLIAQSFSAAEQAPGLTITMDLGSTASIGMGTINGGFGGVVPLDDQSTLVTYTPKPTEEYDPLRAAGISVHGLRQLRAREILAAHAANVSAATVTGMLDLLRTTTTYRQAVSSTVNEVHVPAGTLPGAGAEAAMLVTLATSLLGVPLGANLEVLGEAAKLLLVLISRYPQACVCTPIWSGAVKTVLRLADSPNGLIRTAGAGLFSGFMRFNFEFGSRADTTLVNIGWSDSKSQTATGASSDATVSSIVEQLLDMRTRRTLAQTRVAALVGVSTLTSDNERILTYWQDRRQGQKPGKGQHGMDLAMQDFALTFSANHATAEAFRQGLDLIRSTVAGIDQGSSLWSYRTGVEEICESLAGIVRDSRNIAYLQREISKYDIGDVADLYVRQACMYLSVPVISLRWLESLMNLLLNCSTTVSGAAPAKLDARPPDSSSHQDKNRNVEAGMAAVCAAAVVSSRMLVPFDRLIDNNEAYQHGFNAPDGTRVIRLGDIIIPRLAQICPALESLVSSNALSSHSNVFAESIQQATAFAAGDEATAVARLDAADLTVADAYSNPSRDNMEKLLKLLQIATGCFHREGPFSEFTVVVLVELSELMRRLASHDGLLFNTPRTPADAAARGSALLVPHQHFLDRTIRKITMNSFLGATRTRHEALALALTPGAGWWGGVSAAAERLASAASASATRTESQPMSNFYLVCVYGKRYFELVRKLSEDPTSGFRTAGNEDVTGVRFIYRQPPWADLGDFKDTFRALWNERIKKVLGSFISKCPKAHAVAILRQQLATHRSTDTGNKRKAANAAAAAIEELERRLAAAEAEYRQHGQDELLSPDDFMPILEAKTTGNEAGFGGPAGQLTKLVATATVKPKDIEESENRCKVVLQVATIQSMEIAPFFGPRGGIDWSFAQKLLTNEAGRPVPVEAVDQFYSTICREDSVTGLADSPKNAGYKSGLHVNRFFFTSQVNCLTGAHNAEGGPYFTAGVRTIMTTSLELPALLPRLRIVQTDEVTLKPIRETINAMKNRVEVLEFEVAHTAAGDRVPRALDPTVLQRAPPDDPDTAVANIGLDRSAYTPGSPIIYKEDINFGIREANAHQARSTTSLQMQLNGSILVLVNAGPVATVEPFLSGTPQGDMPPEMRPTADEIRELRICCARLHRALRLGLDAEAAFCALETQPFHWTLENAFVGFTQNLRRLMVPIDE